MKNYPSIQRIAELQQMIVDFALVERVIPFPNTDRKENDVEHSFALAMTCWFLAPKIVPELDLAKILTYALAHDTVELHAGDTYVIDKDRVKSKSEREDKAIEQLSKDWPDFSELSEAAKRYKDHADAEATFVYVIDKMLPPILINSGAKDKFWHTEKFTYKMHEEIKRNTMTISDEGKIYLEKLNEWLVNPDYFYPEDAGDKA